MKKLPKFDFTNGKERFVLSVSDGYLHFSRSEKPFADQPWFGITFRYRFTPNRARLLAVWLNKYADWMEEQK